MTPRGIRGIRGLVVAGHAVPRAPGKQQGRGGTDVYTTPLFTATTAYVVSGVGVVVKRALGR